MVTYTQAKRPIAVTTPLGKDALLLTAFSGQEEISRLFRYDLELLSEKTSIAAPDIVGKNVTFWTEFPNGQPRYFNGFVQRFAYCGTGDRLSTYRAQVVPCLGKKDEHSSCWIRCAQSSAGKGWGASSLPRIGQEVVVTYLEGDPDRPLVTGVVYNQSQMPPYELPAEKTKTYFKSNSSKGGSGFNELRFEDSGGKVQLYLHAQKDMDLRVLNDQREIVLGKKHLIVGGKVGDQLERIDKDKHVTIKGKLQEEITGNVLTAIAGEQHTVIDKTRSEKVGKVHNLTIGGARNEKVSGKYSLQAKSLHAKTDSDTAIEASTIHIKAAQTLILEAGMKLSLSRWPAWRSTACRF